MKKFPVFLFLVALSAAFSPGCEGAAACPYRDEQSWRSAVPGRYLAHPAFTYVEASPFLPDVLIIGDSISLSYTPGVRERLWCLANVYRAPDNCRSTRQTLENLDEYLGSRNWDVIHFNCGIHDITLFSEEGRACPDGVPQVPVEEYRHNLERIVERLEETGAELMLATTTPVANDVALRRNEDVVLYNAAAMEIARRRKIRVNDLHRLISDREESLWSDGVHFTGEGAAVLAEAVAGKIQKGGPVNAPFASPGNPLIIPGGEKVVFEPFCGFSFPGEADGKGGFSAVLRIIANGTAAPGSFTVRFNGAELPDVSVSPSEEAGLNCFDFRLGSNSPEKGLNRIEIYALPGSSGLYINDLLMLVSE